MDLSMDLINKIPFLIYIVDIENNDLLFVNSFGENIYGHNWHGKKCYDYFFKFNNPCDFCHMDQCLHSESKTLNRTFTVSEIGNMNYLISSNIITFNNKKCLLSLCNPSLESTDSVSFSRNDTDFSSINTFSNKLAKILSSSDKYSAKIEQLANNVRSSYDAILTIIFIKKEGEFINCSSSVKQKDRLPLVENKNFYQNCEDYYSYLVRANRKKISVEHDITKVLAHNVNISEILSAFNAKNAYTSFIDEKSTGLNGFIIVVEPRNKYLDTNYLNMVSLLLTSIYSKIDTSLNSYRLSYYDDLTGSLNRNSYINKINELKDVHLSSLGIIFIDINGLKYANDNYGHAYGDSLIIRTADTIRKVFPLFYRIGGDEFVIIDEDSSSRQFYNKVEVLQTSLCSKDTAQASIGAIFETNNIKVDEMIDKADNYMYKQKSLFYEMMNIKLNSKDYSSTVLLTEIKRTISKGLFRLLYLPRFDLNTMKCIGYDIKARITNPYFKNFTTIEFIHFLEKTNTYADFDFEVINRICSGMKSFHSKFGVYPVAFYNTSSTVFEDDYALRLGKILDSYKIPRKYFCTQLVNITEEHINLVYEAGNKLKEQGLTLALNHFGRSTANLQLLQKIKLDSLKLDESLTENISTKKGERILITGIVNLCKDLNITVMCSEINNANDLETIKDIGICYGRGKYLYSGETEDDFIDYEQKTHFVEDFYKE